MWVIAARLSLLVAAIAGLIYVQSEPVVEVAAAIVAGLALQLVTSRRSTRPAALPATAEPEDEGAGQGSE